MHVRTARWLDETIARELLFEREGQFCTRAGLDLFAQDMHAVFEMFGDGPSSRKFKLTSESLALLQRSDQELARLRGTAPLACVLTPSCRPDHFSLRWRAGLQDGLATEGLSPKEVLAEYGVHLPLEQAAQLLLLMQV